MNNSLTLNKDTDQYILNFLCNENSVGISPFTLDTTTIFVNFKTITSVAITCRALKNTCEECCTNTFNMPLKDRFFEICKINHILISYQHSFKRNMDTQNPYDSFESYKEYVENEDGHVDDEFYNTYGSILHRTCEESRPFIFPVTDCASLIRLSMVSDKTDSNLITKQIVRTLILLNRVIQHNFKGFDPNEEELADIIVGLCMRNFGSEEKPQYPLLQFTRPMLLFNKHSLQTMTLKILNEIKSSHNIICSILNKDESSEPDSFTPIRNNQSLNLILENLNKPEESEPFFSENQTIIGLPIIVSLLIFILQFYGLIS